MITTIIFLSLPVVVISALTVQRINEHAAPSQILLADLYTSQLSGDLSQVKGVNNSQILGRAVVDAISRKNILLKLMDTNPQAVINSYNVLSSKITSSHINIPPEIKPYLEKPLNNESMKFYHFHGDQVTGKPEVEMTFLVDKNNSTSYYHPASNFNTPINGSSVFVSGVMIDNHIAVSKLTTQLAQNFTWFPIIGNKRVAIVLFNFHNDRSRPETRSDVSFQFNNATNSVASFMRDTSYDKLNLHGDVFDWITIPDDKENANYNCNYFKWFYDAKSALGPVLSDYDYIVFQSPYVNCKFFGEEGELSGFGPYPLNFVYINGFEWGEDFDKFLTPDALWPLVVSHELGHIFSLQHSSAYYCKDNNGKYTPISKNCTVLDAADENGDMGYPMMKGDANTLQYNAYEKGRIGWLNPSNTNTVTWNNNKGIYILYPLEQNSGLISIQIPRQQYPGGPIENYYYLEWRQPLDFWDSHWYWSDGYPGVEVRIAPDYSTINTTDNDVRSKLIGVDWNHNEVTILPGDTFYDPIYNISIKVISIVPRQFATVQIAFGGLLPTSGPTYTPVPTQPCSVEHSGGTCVTSGICKDNGGISYGTLGCLNGLYCCTFPSLTPTPVPTKIPTPTPTPKPCSTQHADGICISSGICNSNSGINYGTTGCFSGKVCCVFPTPTLTPTPTQSPCSAQNCAPDARTCRSAGGTVVSGTCKYGSQPGVCCSFQ